jgi:hypothetical protein
MMMNVWSIILHFDEDEKKKKMWFHEGENNNSNSNNNSVLCGGVKLLTFMFLCRE